MAGNKFSGRGSLRARLGRTERAVRDAVRQELQKGGLLIEGTAAASIQEQTPSGTFYPSRGRKGALHEASPPGSPPNADTGELHTGITSTTQETPTRIIVETGSNSPHGPPLELGTSKMAPRPFMSPAFRKHVDRIRDMVGQGARRAAQQARRK